jgi:hypothetical protein
MSARSIRPHAAARVPDASVPADTARLVWVKGGLGIVRQVGPDSLDKANAFRANGWDPHALHAILSGYAPENPSLW